MPDELEPTEPPDRPENHIAALLERARRGEADVLGELRAALDADVELRRRVGDLAMLAEGAWIAMIAGNNLLFREALTLQVAELKAALAGPAPTPLEALLTQRVAAAWMMAQHADAAYAQAAGTWTARQADHGLDRIDRANRRLAAAVGALATLRKLLPGDGRGASVAATSTTGPPDGVVAEEASVQAGGEAAKEVGTGEAAVLPFPRPKRGETETTNPGRNPGRNKGANS